jgi:hypothetical protein
MPLSERSARSGRQVEGVPESPVNSILRTYADHGSDIRSAPSSIQSMLKNTTETGDIGAFSIHPTYKSYPVSRASPSPRASSLTHASPHLPRQNSVQKLGGDGHHNSLLSYRGTTASSIISLYQSESQKSLRLPGGYPLGSKQRTFSMSQSSQVSWNMSNHRSYGSLRPHSPFAYPTRLKRPGYRPSSPALTDFTGTDTRTQFGLDRGSNFRTPSPLSVYSTTKTPPGYPSAMNRSMPSLRCAPLPFPGSQSRNLTEQGTPFRPPRSKSQSFYSNQPLPYRPQQENRHGNVENAYRSPLPTPLYYDYSEAFEERKHSDGSNPSMTSLADPLSPERKSPGDQSEIIDSETRPKLLRTPTNGSLNPGISSDNSLVDWLSPVAAPKPILSWETEQAQTQDNFSELDTRKESAAIAWTVVKTKDTQAPPAQIFHEATVGHHILSSSRPQTRDRMIRGSQHTTVGRLDSHTPQPQGTQSEESVHFRNPSILEQGSFLNNEPKLSSLEGYTAYAPWNFQAFDLGKLASESRICDNVDGQLARSQEFSSPPILSTPTIQAPVPDRSVSLRNNIDRISRILSIGGDIVGGAYVTEDSDSNSENKRGFSACGEHYSQAVSQKHGDNEGVIGYRHPFYLQPSSPGLQHRKPLASKENNLSISVRQTDPGFQAPLSPAPIHAFSTPQRSTMESVRPTEADMGHSSRTIVTTPNFDYASLEVSDNQAEISSPEVADRLPSESEKLIEEDLSSKSTSLTTCPGLDGTFHETPPKSVSGTDLGHNKQNPEMCDSELLCPVETSPTTDNNFPPFKLRVTRASSSTNGTIMVSKHSSSLASSPRQSMTAPVDLFQVDLSPHKMDPVINSSIGSRSKYSATRVHDNDRLETLMRSAPQSEVGPSSPALQVTDVQSFFSDDSSNAERKSTLRQRLSQFKVLASRGNSTDDLRKGDHGRSESMATRIRVSRLNRGHLPGNTDMQDGRTSESKENFQRAKRSIGGKLKTLFRRGEKKLKVLGIKLIKRTEKRRSESSALYPGV